MKTVFHKYQVCIKRKDYYVYIPQGITCMKASGYLSRHWGADVYGNRTALESVLTASYLLGMGKNMLVYYPLLKLQEWQWIYDCHYRESWSMELHQAWEQQDEKDLVMMNHTVQFPRGHWELAKKQMAKMKPEIISYRFKEDKIYEIFQKEYKKWTCSDAGYRKEGIQERIRNETAFYIISRNVAKEWYLQLYDLLQKDLERNFLDRQNHYVLKDFVVMDRYNTDGMEMGFYDDRLYRQEIRERRLKDKGDVIHFLL